MLFKMDYNSTEAVQLRRYKNRLSQSGEGFIVFGLWNILKTVMVITMRDDVGFIASEITDGSIDPEIVNGIIIVMYIIVSAVIMAVHFRAGRGAVRYAKGKSRKRSFLVLTGVILLFSAAAVPGVFSQSGDAVYRGADTMIASVLIDLTMIFISLDMFRCVIKIKHLAGTEADSEEEN